MCDLICGVISCCVWSSDAGKINVQRGPKSKPLPNDQNIVLNRIKPVNEIIFIRQIKV